ncbi:hypothetical protein SDC9_183918 [bioreactor metagenome]|uniref:Uncharacterized protein n=1 Tax=bioreactor metagenome TaxID=1076179 RepID=A0A645HE51_9ZZZZ
MLADVCVRRARDARFYADAGNAGGDLDYIKSARGSFSGAYVGGFDGGCV